MKRQIQIYFLFTVFNVSSKKYLPIIRIKQINPLDRDNIAHRTSLDTIAHSLLEKVIDSKETSVNLIVDSNYVTEQVTIIHGMKTD